MSSILSPHQRQHSSKSRVTKAAAILEEIERRHILRVLKAVSGNKTTAAEVLGFDRRTLYRKLERYGESLDGETRDR